MNTLKKCLPDAIVIVIFAVISFAYFFVPVSQGKILFRHDSQASVGLGQELTQYEQRTGEVTRWTNSVLVVCQPIKSLHRIILPMDFLQ